MLTQDLDRTVGVFDFLVGDSGPLAVLPSETEQKLVYREDVLTATVSGLAYPARTVKVIANTTAATIVSP